MPNVPMNITAIAENFVRQIVAATESAAAERIQNALAKAFGVAQRRGPGRPKAASAAAPQRAARPKQLCPVPGCTNPAAPVFGMVCAKHKNVPKAKIKKYRAARKADVQKTPAGRKARKASPKLARARKLQGQYLGALKSLSDADKAKVKAVARDKGVADALKLAKSLKK